MTRETFDLFLLFLALALSALFIVRNRMTNPPKWVVASEILGFLVLAFLGAWSMSVPFPGDVPQKIGWSDIAITMLGGIGWFSILNRLAKTPFKKIYCATCWWRVEGTPFNKCLNSAELGNPGSWINDKRIGDCLNCGGHRSRATELPKYLRQ